MICPKCSNQINDGALFCGNCGYKIDNSNNKQEKKSISLNLNKNQKIIIVSLLSVLVILLLIAAFFVSNNTSVFSNKESTRTIMIYLDGTNLESDAGIASAELEAINPSTLNLNKTTVLVYTGGTLKWYNYVKNDENAIYKLTSNGFEKIETYDKMDMADPSTLASFLQYSYDNYKAGHMDLVLFDHGGATTGAISDDFTGNTISLAGFKEALTMSPFDENNKLELIAFRTCLNGTIENANTFKDFAEYLVASEEVTYGRSDSNVLGYFINNMPPNEGGIEVGKRFVNAYIKNIDDICYSPDQFLVTYSVVDLSKVDKLTQEFESAISSIDIKKNYSNLSKVRGNMLQFAANGSNDSTYFDTIDMYDLMVKLDELSIVDASSFKNAFNDAVVYFYTNDPYDTHGLSVYFPYKGEKRYRDYLVKLYDTFDFMTDYKKFINSFNSILNGTGDKTFSFNNSTLNVSDSKEVTLELSEEQKSNYSTARYVLFKKDSENPDFYELILISDDVDESETGKIKTKIGNSLVKVYDENGDNIYLHLNRRKLGDKFVDSHNAILYNKNAGDFGKMDNANITIINNNNKPKFGDVIITGARDQRYDGIVRNINDYTAIDMFKLRYKILDENGNFLSSDKWETSGTMTGLELKDFKNDDVDLRYTGMDDGEFYCAFIIFDMNRNMHLSNLIKVGE